MDKAKRKKILKIFFKLKAIELLWVIGIVVFVALLMLGLANLGKYLHNNEIEDACWYYGHGCVPEDDAYMGIAIYFLFKWTLIIVLIVAVLWLFGFMIWLWIISNWEEAKKIEEKQSKKK